MKVGVAGVGEMGSAIAGHLQRKGHDVRAFDVDASRLDAAAGQGIATVTSLESLAGHGELFLVDRFNRRSVRVCNRNDLTACKSGRAYRRGCHQ